MVLDQLEHIELDDDARERLGLGARSWSLRRAWPRSPQLVLLEYADDAGRTLAGQWRADPAQLQRVCAQTARSGAAWLARAGSTRVVLQAHGADRKLVGIASLRDQLGPCELLVHRPERRAVLRAAPDEPIDQHAVYAKVTRPGSKTQAAIDAGLRAARIMDDDPQAPACPRLVDASPDLGIALWSAVPGVALHDLLAAAPPVPASRIERIARSISSMLSRLHTSPPSPGTPEHTPADEAAVLVGWLSHLRWAAPDRASTIEPLIQSVCGRLAQLPRVCLTIHRDLHDKQILIDTDNRIGVIDFDTLTTGDPALDLGNLIAHAQLRVAQRHWRAPTASRFIQTLIDAADPATRASLGVWIEAAQLRLACLYTFRPKHTARVFDAFVDPVSIAPHAHQPAP